MGVKLAGSLLLYPVADHYRHPYPSYTERARGQTLTSSLMRWFWDTWLAGRTADEAETAGMLPLRRADLSALPPSLLITAEHDPLRDEGRALAVALQAAGVALTHEHYGNAEHGFACSEGPSSDFQHFMVLASRWLDTLPASSTAEP